MNWIEDLRPKDMVIVHTSTTFEVRLKEVEKVSLSRSREDGVKEILIYLRGGGRFNLRGKGLGAFKNKWLEQVKKGGE